MFPVVSSSTGDRTAAEPAPLRSDSISADHLLFLLEKQPSCLIRVAVDGTLLAVNEAGLGLLGVARLDLALGRSLSACVPYEWSEFAARVWELGSGSLECELTDLAGDSKNVRFQGMA